MRGVRAGVATALAMAALAGCGGVVDEGPVAVTADLTLDRPSVPFGGPLEMSYAFTVAADAPAIDGDYRVFVHFRDPDGGLLWGDDHEPPVPVADWLAGTPVRYTRTMFLPRVAYVGVVEVEVGLFSPATGARLRLDVPEAGNRAYRLASVEVTAQTHPIDFGDGWHPAEQGTGSMPEEWRWSMAAGRLGFVNPEDDTVLYLDVDQPVALPVPQHVEVRVGDVLLDEFDVPPAERLLRRIPIGREIFGDAPTGEVRVLVDRVFVPREVDGLGSIDTRSLGVRVFRAVLLGS